MAVPQEASRRRIRRHNRVRKTLRGTAQRQRIAVFVQQAHLRPGLDDIAGVTLASASTTESACEGDVNSMKAATKAGALLAERAKRLASKGSCSTAVASATTAGSRHSPAPPAREDEVLWLSTDVTARQPRDGGEASASPASSASTEWPRSSRAVVVSRSRLVVIGDGAGQVGLGYGKAKEVPLAIKKGTEEAGTNLFTVPMAGTTIVHETIGELGASRVMLKPAAPGTGVIAGGAAAPSSKRPASPTCCASRSVRPIRNVAATIEGLKGQRRPDEVARLRGLDPEEFSVRCGRPTRRASAASTSKLRRGGLMALKVTQLKSNIGYRPSSEARWCPRSAWHRPYQHPAGPSRFVA